MSWSKAASRSTSGRAAARDVTVEADAERIVGIEQRRALDDRFERVPVDGEPVVGVPLRARLHVLPLREQTHEQSDVVERLEHRDRTAPGAEEAR